MQTYDFAIQTSGHVRIDAESVEAATEEFIEQFAQEPVLVTATQDQILVLDGILWEDPTIYVERSYPDSEEGPEEGTDG